MSMLGKIFIVINLLLAGVFVGFAATYLDQADNWKAKHATLAKEMEQKTDSLTSQLSQEAAKSADLTAKLLQADTKLSQEESSNAELKDENQRLEGQLAQLSGSLNQMKGDLATVSSTLERSVNEYTSSMQLAIKAGEERDAAVRAKDVAVADLADANNRITALTETVEARDASLAMASDKIAEQGILLDNIRRIMPGSIVAELAMPSLKGTVQHVAGDLLTVQVTSNPASAEILPGYRFAIAGGTDNYKGEALVTEVDGTTAFCRLTIKDGESTTVSVGDAAMTHTF